jgi:hypothetical protein
MPNYGRRSGGLMGVKNAKCRVPNCGERRRFCFSNLALGIRLSASFCAQRRHCMKRLKGSCGNRAAFAGKFAALF